MYIYNHVRIYTYIIYGIGAIYHVLGLYIPILEYKYKDNIYGLYTMYIQYKGYRPCKRVIYHVKRLYTMYLCYTYHV